MYFLVYISTSVKLMTQADLTFILESSVKNNSQLGITGMLMYARGTFIQALEGEEQAIKEMYEVIEKDNKHKNVIILATGEISERVFPGWSMAFLAPNPEKMAELEGYINPLRNKLFENGDKHTIINILKTFADNNDLTHS